MGEDQQPQQTTPAPLFTLDYASPLPTHAADPLATWALISCALFPVTLAVACGMGSEGLICVAILGPILPIFLGWLALTKPSARGQAKAAIWIGAGQIALIIVTILLILPGPSPKTRERANRVKCASNLRQIGRGIALYANDNAGQLPLRFDQLITDTDISPEAFICPTSDDERATGPTTQAMLADFAKPSRCSYVYLGAGLNIKDLPPTFILAHEKMENHDKAGMNVLYADGHVDWHPANDAQRILDALAAGQNPPATQPATGQ